MDTPSGSSDTESFDFEAALKELEGLVERMERGELSLEESLRQFERGVELTRACQKALQDAEQKVETLIGQGADAHEQAFEDPEHRGA
ncbi:exodeoxyribonuclease VII small subunit [Alkalispirillum mobile]|uniref:Exodeoxyribonuclease 7 small subunit n=1 Tax=Alkalispirillum mobile TaxID=85925 RepID=A0A498C289_9GAMM|nr:exodeoxyribonuclease VII small subunit [Alkalispirillum mobile]RLK48716.1 exodeoxyribonuclease VII small subunit [Alkalispirillum mobile]